MGSVVSGKFRSSLDKTARDVFDMSHWNSRTTTVFNVLDKKLESRVRLMGITCMGDRYSWILC